MIPFVAMAVIIAVSFSLFLFNTFTSFRDFHQRSQSMSLWDTMTLASTNRVVRETNSFLAALKDSLLKSIKSYNPNSGQVDSSLNAERISIIQDYLSKLDLKSQDSPLKYTIEFGLAPFDSKGSKNYSDAYTATLVHSDYVPVKLDDSAKSYASSLLTDQQVAAKLNIEDLESQIMTSDNLKISSDLLAKLVDADSLSLIKSNPGLFNIEIRDDGLNLNNLPNGIEVNITTSVTSSQT
jgi:hypothetical protein